MPDSTAFWRFSGGLYGRNVEPVYDFFQTDIPT